MYKWHILLLLLLSATSGRCQQPAAPPPPNQLRQSIAQSKHTLQVKNVILLIGDGMGLSQITAGMYANDNYLHLERMRIIGLHKPYSSSHLVTDSAAGATAFACGIKTYNGAIGVGPDSIACKTILQVAKEKGLATGLLATSTIVHATPAAFIAHNTNRKNYEAIAEAFPESDIDYFVGGGLRYFRNRKKDDRDILRELQDLGYQIGNYFDSDIDDVTPDPSRAFGFLTAYEDPLPASNGRNYLAGATSQALQFLSQRSDRGFFIMIEGSQIDWGGHANSGEYVVSEMLDFDKAIGKALDFADRTPGTLVIVTADHEAGGMAINPESSWQRLRYGFTTIGHTGTLIPVFAYGPGAEEFAGIYENTAIYDKLMTLLRFQPNKPVPMRF
jgi:alkaline phosphatase